MPFFALCSIPQTRSLLTKNISSSKKSQIALLLKTYFSRLQRHNTKQNSVCIHKHQSINTLQFPVITSKSYKLMSNHLHGGKLSRDFAMDGEYTALTFTSIFNLRSQCDPRVRRGIPKGGRRQPPFGCHRQRDKTSNRGY